MMITIKSFIPDSCDDKAQLLFKNVPDEGIQIRVNEKNKNLGMTKFSKKKKEEKKTYIAA